MSRRVIGLGVAALLALIGTVALVGYVNSAEQRALAGEQLVEVYVVAGPVPAGTPAESLAELVVVERVPAKVRAVGAIDDLASVAGLVAGVDLVPGEQLVSGRFMQPSELTSRGAGLDVPEDLLEVTVETDAQRAIGGLIEPGQTVTVFASFGSTDTGPSVVELDGEAVPVPGAASGTGQTTGVLLRKALVTAVQEPSGRPASDQRITTSPAGSLFVTLAVQPYDAERLVFTAEYGSIWFAIERDTVPDVELPGQNMASVLQDEGAR